LFIFHILLGFGPSKFDMAMSSNYLDATLKETFRRSPFKFANTKVPHAGLGDSVSPIKEVPEEEEVPNDPVNIQIPFIESALSTSRLRGKSSLYHSQLINRL